MGEIVNLEQFRNAAAVAKTAAGTRLTTGRESSRANQRCAGITPVKHPSSGASDFEDDYGHWDEMAELQAAEDAFAEYQQEIFDEIAIEQEDWARSNEDGWFYGDEDPV